MSQTLQSLRGATAYETLGATSGFDPIPLGEYVFLISGRPGSGKSSLGMSIPNALLLDWEGGAPQVLHQHAMRIPGRGPLSAETYRKVFDQLVEDAKKNKRVFTSIVFDSLDRWWDTEVVHATDLFRKENPKSEMRSILQNDEWGNRRKDVYASMLGDLRTLQSVGYGLVLFSHLVEETKVVPGKGEQTTWKRRLPPGLVGPIAALSEVVGLLEQTLTQEQESVTRVIRGRKITSKGAVTDVIKHVLTFSSSNVYQDAKSRMRLGKSSVELSGKDGWKQVEAIYHEAVSKCKKELVADV